MNEKTTPFDIAEHLKDDEDIVGFLSEVASEGNSSDLLHALSIASRAKGMPALQNRQASTGKACTAHSQKMAHPSLKLL